MKRELNPKKERVAVVAGGAGFLGSFVAKSLLKSSYRVIVLDKNQTVQETDYLENYTFLETDLLSQNSVDRSASELIDKLGTSPNLLVCTAGVTDLHKHFLDISLKEWKEQIKANLDSYFLVTQSIARKMVDYEKPGHILLFGSIGSIRAHREQVPYDTAKGGVESLCRALALDLDPYNIRVNTLGIGPVKNSGSTLKDGRRLKELRRLVPLNSYAKPKDIGEIVVELDKKCFCMLTGQMIVIDGGLSIQLRPLGTERIENPKRFKL